MWMEHGRVSKTPEAKRSSFHFYFQAEQTRGSVIQIIYSASSPRRKKCRTERNVAVFFFFLTGEYADPNLVTLAQHSNTSDQWLQLRRIFLLCAF